MKSTNRIRKNASTRKGAHQIKTPPIPAHQFGDIDLVLVSEKGGSSVAGVNLSDEEFARLKHSAARQNISLEQLLVLGFEQMASPPPTPDQRMKLIDLENSIGAAASFLTMVMETADSGLKSLTNILIFKLNDDFAAARAAIELPAAKAIAFGQSTRKEAV